VRDQSIALPLGMNLSTPHGRGLLHGHRPSRFSGTSFPFKDPDGNVLSSWSDMVGVYGDTKREYRHKAQIWGMYVTPRARHHGLGRALLEAALEHCRSWPGVTHAQLCVSAKAEAAKRLYERHGFKEWGREPKALLVGDELLDDIHMIRWL
jgi:GNAT superfamily N-acetyltransferase